MAASRRRDLAAPAPERRTLGADREGARTSRRRPARGDRAAYRRRWDARGPTSTRRCTRNACRRAARVRRCGARREPAPLVPCHSSIVSAAPSRSGRRRPVEVAFDRGTIVAGAHGADLRGRVRAEGGRAAALVEVARAGIDAHACGRARLEGTRGDALARHAGRCAAVRARPPELARTMAPAALRRAILKACIDQVVANASILAAGQRDDEAVHQLRVGLRRLRTAVRELAARRGSSDAGLGRRDHRPLSPPRHVPRPLAGRGLGAARPRCRRIAGARCAAARRHRCRRPGAADARHRGPAGIARGRRRGRGLAR